MSDRGMRLYDANAPPRHRGETRQGGTNPFEEMVKEMNLHLKCHARFEEKMKSQRQPDDFSDIKATRKRRPDATALRRQSASRDKLIPKLSPRLS